MVKDETGRVNTLEDIVERPHLIPFVMRGSTIENVFVTSTDPMFRRVLQQVVRTGGLATVPQVLSRRVFDLMLDEKAVIFCDKLFLDSTIFRLYPEGYEGKFYQGTHFFLVNEFVMMVRRKLDPEITRKLHMRKAVSGTPRCIRAPGGDLSEAIPPAQDRGAVVVRRTSRGTGGEESAYHVMTVELQVLCALRFYGTGSFQGMVASDEHVARDKKTVSVAVRAVSVAIVRRLGVQRGWIHFPETPSERFDAEKGFRLLGRIPGVIGCVDGTMVSIVGPSKNDPTVTKAAYWCRKYFYALNVMVVSTLMLRCQNAPQISRKKKKNVLPIRFKYAVL
ncbi:hypothetical protein ISCGN_012012 [Ixodes scapularis]